MKKGAKKVGDICKIYLFRHGKTYYNEKHIFTGWKDSKLSPQGIKEAKIIARKLKGKRIDMAVYTHLSRSKDTLNEVLKFHPECHIFLQDDRMIERSYGKLQGMSHKHFIKKYGLEKFNKIHRSYETSPPSGESIKVVEKRVLAFIKDLLILMKKNKINVAISAHGNSMRPFRRYFEHLSVKQMIKLENPYDDYFEYSVKC